MVISKNLIPQDKTEELRQLIDKAARIVITCHLSPDGDAMGSSLGLCRALRNLGKEVRVITPDTPPRYLTFLPGADRILIYSRSEPYAKREMADADIIFCLDYNDPKRVDLVAPGLLASKAKKVMIDHHLEPAAFPDITISHPEVSSTSALVYMVLEALGLEETVDKEAATAIYTGMMTDTGNFSYNSNDPRLYSIIACLIAKGINKDEIYRAVYFTNSVNRLRLNGFAMHERFRVFPEHRAALITLTREELNAFQYQKGDTEDLVNRPLTCPAITYSIFLREESDYIKVSTRSKGDFPVNRLCAEFFNGGGHLNAAGGEFYGTLDEAIDAVYRAMPLYDRYLPPAESQPSGK